MSLHHWLWLTEVFLRPAVSNKDLLYPKRPRTGRQTETESREQKEKKEKWLTVEMQRYTGTSGARGKTNIEE